MNKEIIDKMVEMSVSKHTDSLIQKVVKALSENKLVDVLIKPVDIAKPYIKPEYASIGAAAMDISSAEPDFDLKTSEIKMVSTNISVAIPDGYEIQVRPRSGLAAKYGVTVVNSPGTVDSDYRGEIKVILVNHGGMTATIKTGDRIAQLVLVKVEKANLVAVKDLPPTERGEKGFGSTGTGLLKEYMDRTSMDYLTKK